MTEREKEREKLIELLEEADQVAQAKGITDYKDAIADNADHLLSNGVIVPHCKVGDKVWYLFFTPNGAEVRESEIEKVIWKQGKIHKIKGWYIALAYNDAYEMSHKEIGKTVFLTKEEAEAKLREVQG